MGFDEAPDPAIQEKGQRRDEVAPVPECSVHGRVCVSGVRHVATQ